MLKRGITDYGSGVYSKNWWIFHRESALLLRYDFMRGQCKCSICSRSVHVKRRRGGTSEWRVHLELILDGWWDSNFLLVYKLQVQQDVKET